MFGDFRYSLHICVIKLSFMTALRKYPALLLAAMMLLLAGACGKGDSTPVTPGGGGEQQEQEGEGEGEGGEGGGGEDTPPTPPEPNPPGDPITIQVATYNLLKPSGRRSEMSLELPEVRTALGNAIKATCADLIAFNEVDENYIPGGAYSIKDICGDSMEDWVWRMEWPNSIDSDYNVTYSYANGYAYNPAVLEELNSRYVWISKTEIKYFTYPQDAYKKVGSPQRTCIMVLFRHRASNKVFCVFISHLPTQSQGGASIMAGGVSLFAYNSAGSLPQILLGDMNSAPSGDNTGPYKTLMAYWKDGWSTAEGTQSGSSAKYYYTYSVFTTNHPERRIDHILTRGCEASEYYTIKETYWHRSSAKYWCPSDHLPVTATITIP